VGHEHRQALLDGLRVSARTAAGMAESARAQGDEAGAQQLDADFDTLIDYAATLGRGGGV
jgi:hypothetical protein